MILNINSTRGQTRFLTCVARVTCLVIRNICSPLYDFKLNFLKTPKNVSFEKTSGRLNRISNDVSGSRYARRNDFDDIKI